jgi:hypothetical protein
MVESVMGFAAATVSFVPDVGSPFAMKYGGTNLGNGLERFKVSTGAIGDFSGAMATSAGLEAGWARRDQGWEHEVDTADDELAVVKKEHEAARLRLQIAQRALETHQRTLEQHEEMRTFVEDKFTGLGHYTWLCANGQRLLREGFHGAYALAKMAERAFQYERDDPTSRLAPGFWDAGHAGLNAGAQLMIALQAMERRFLETDTRDLEVDQPFALSQIDPKALMQLRLSGECEFEIPEWAFDLFYPGQYRRRIKALRLTIPCVTGPYTNVSATLTLLGSSIRRTPDPAAAALSDIPVSRTDSVATSSGQSDAGVFELQFRDEKVLPFEGGGGLSRWRLRLPKNFRPFDYNTINDVLVQLSYTALWDGALADRVESTNAGLEGALAKALADVPSRRLFSMRQEFSPEFTRLLRSPVDTGVSIAITERHLPSYVTDGSRSVTIDEAVLLLRTVDGLDPGAFSLSVNGTDVSGFAADPEFQGVYSTDVTAALGSVFADHVISITDADVLAPAAPTPGDVSAVDGELLADMALSVSYTVA